MSPPVQKKIIFSDYLKAIILFLFFTTLGLACFFYRVENDVQKNTTQSINEEIGKQISHFQSTLQIHYEYLNGIADSLGKSDQLLSDENLDLVSSIYKSAVFNHVCLVEPDGTAHYEDSSSNSVAERRYFNEAISGKQTLSDPIESKKDGSTCVVLGVPIYENGDKSGKIIGVLGGSYNISALSQTLFNNYFDGSGYFLMVNQDGEVMFTDNSIDYNESSAVNVPIEKLKDNFAAQEYGQLKFEDNGRAYYLVYAPFKTNNWSVCYCIPVSKAKEAYHFITKYEVILAVYLIVVVISLTLWIMVRNIQKERQIIRNSKIDALTGAQNKKSTQDSIEEWFTNEDCHGLQAFLMFDVDKFKQVNDEHGHIAGDAALRQIGNLLKSYFRNDDIIGRIGGDEFVVMMKNVSSIEDAVHRAENLQLRMHSLEIPELGGAHITCSMGLSFYPNNGSTYMELYSRADSALYISKERGRNTCTIYGDAPHDSYNI